MAERDLGTLLAEAFEVRAQELVPDALSAPGFPVAERAHRRRWLAPLASAAAVVTAVAIGVAVSRDGSSPNRTGGHATVGVRLAAMPTPSGVGLPVTARFDKPFTDARGLQAATTVTADGKRLDARWYFVRTSGRLTGLLRPKSYWPAHARITVRIAKGAGQGPAFTLDRAFTFGTGSADVAKVDSKAHTLTLSVDGAVRGTYPVSLGESGSPTSRGVKVITEQRPTACLSGPGYHECGIKDVQTVVPGREYLLGAPWEIWAMGKQDVSRGSTDMRPQDAAKLYRALRVGDVVEYPNADGPLLDVTQTGWWNVPWSAWSAGGAVPTR